MTTFVADFLVFFRRNEGYPLKGIDTSSLMFIVFVLFVGRNEGYPLKGIAF